MAFASSRLTVAAIGIGAAALAVGAITLVVHPHEGPDGSIDGTSGYVALASLVVALLGIAPGFLALGERARSNKGAIAAAAGVVVLGLTCITSIVNGEDLSIFAVLAPITNAAWLFGSIALAISLRRVGTVPRFVWIGLPLAWFATIPLSQFGGGLLAASFWGAVAYLLADEQDAAEAALTAIA
jgi:hypothetical protein